MENVTIWHNPRCSKSRNALALLEENGIEAEVVKYLDTPPTKEELANILQLLGKQPQDIIRFGESIAKTLHLSVNDQRTSDEWLDIMIKHPILIERPIVIHEDMAILGRPPENVLKIIQPD